MARSLFLSQTLTLTLTKNPKSNLFRLIISRTQSSSSKPSQFIDLTPIDSSETELRDAIAVQRIEDAIHRIVIKRAAPDWLPFRPGSSYWVPPRRKGYGVADLVQKLENSLSDEMVMALATARGWPSSSYYVDDAPQHPTVELVTASTETSQSEDEEG